MAVAVAQNSSGERMVLVGTSEANGYLRPGVFLKENEVVVDGLRGSHAEVDLMKYADEQGWDIVNLAITRPPCNNCSKLLYENVFK